MRHVVEQTRWMNVCYVRVRRITQNKEAMSFSVRLRFDLLGQIELLQDFSGAPRGKRESGISIHKHKPGYR